MMIGTLGEWLKKMDTLISERLEAPGPGHMQVFCPHCLLCNHRYPVRFRRPRSRSQGQSLGCRWATFPLQAFNVRNP
jgi:hypothetical protein